MVTARRVCYPPHPSHPWYSSLTRKAGTVMSEIAALSTCAPITAG